MKSYLKYFILLTSITNCSHQNNTLDKRKENAISEVESITNCDTSKMSILPIKDRRKELRIWTEDNSFEWFLKYRQSVLKDAICWRGKRFESIDSNMTVKCISEKTDSMFIYIPNDFYKKIKTGIEKINFYIVNNSIDTIKTEMIDATFRHINTSVKLLNKQTNSLEWYKFQETTQFVACGNSFWTMNFPPRTFMKVELDCNYLNLGDSKNEFRIELKQGQKSIYSNSININLMPEQIPYIIDGTK